MPRFLRCVLISSAVLAIAYSASATTLTVTNSNDSGSGSLRQAILDANSVSGDDTIVFQTGVSLITLTSGELSITSNIEIDGPALAPVVISRLNDVSTPNFRIFNISAGSIVSINSIKISGGNLASTGDVGAGINNAGSLTLSNATVNGNIINPQFGSVSGGGIYNSGTLSITNSVITNNTVGSTTNPTVNEGGGITNIGMLNIVSSTVRNNDVLGAKNFTPFGTAKGAGIRNLVGGIVTLVNSTVRENTTSAERSFGGGIYNSGDLTVSNSAVILNSVSGGGSSNNQCGGGGIFSNSSLLFSNSTLSNNSARCGPMFGGPPPSGLDGGGGEYGGGTFRNATISGNVYTKLPIQSAGDLGGGVFHGGEMSNTIVAGNLCNSNPSDVSGSITSDGHNLIQNVGNSSGWINTDLLNQNPLLQPLGNFGGPTLTQALLSASPAIDAGDNTNAPPTDQRGSPRIVNSSMDIGAFENSINVLPISLPSASLGVSYNQALSASRASSLFESTGNGNYLSTLVPFTFTIVVGQLPSGITLSSGGVLSGIPSSTGTFTFDVAATDADGMTGVTELSLVVNGCPVMLSQQGITVSPAAGSFGFNVTAATGCGWQAVTNSQWISITSGPGNGNGSVSFSILMNVGAQRTGTITVADQVFTVTQSTGCSYSINPQGVTVLASGTGLTSFNLTASDGSCPWTVTNIPSWITLFGPATGTGSATINFSVQANALDARTAGVMVAGLAFTVSQASGCSFSISPSSVTIPVAGGSSSFAITTLAGCSWSAISNASWIGITNGSGNGNGNVSFSIAANMGIPRSGTITVGPQTFTVNQGNGCSFNILPSGSDIEATGGAGMFSVLASDQSCTWTAVSNVPWILVTGGSNGSGSGSVGYAVQANSQPARSGTITAAGKTFTVAQASGCTYTLSSDASNIGAMGGSGSFNVTAGTGCAWTATVSSNWIIVNTSSGSGNGTVSFSVFQNTGIARQATIAVADKAFTINEAAGTPGLLKADYQFQGNLNSSISGAQPLTGLIGSGPNAFVADTVDGYSRQVMRFTINGGLALFDSNTLIPNTNFTIVALIRLDTVSSLRRLVDFKNATSQSGAYFLNGRFELESTSNIAVQPNTYVQIAIVREATGHIRLYRDGRLGYETTNDSNIYQIDSANTLRFFQDDTVTPGQASAGDIARLRIYDAPLTVEEVRALDRLPIANGNGQQTVLFMSGRNGTQDIYTMNSDGSNQLRLTTNPAADLSPSWSPDGRKIAFSSNRDGNLEVYIMDRNGQNQTRLTNNPLTDYYPQISPDGSKILFSECQISTPFACDIWLMNIDGTNQINLTNSPGVDDDYGRWSPDGTKIVFSSGRNSSDGLVTEIYLMNADGTNPVRLTNNAAYDLNPAFSPDGTKIVFSSERDNGNGEIYIMNSNGSSQTNITNSPSYDSFPIWSPDGSKIAFTSLIANGTWEEIYSINVNGNGLQRLTSNNAYDYVYGWRRSSNSSFDFDGDGMSDIGITRPNGGIEEWWISRSSDSNVFATVFGVPSDIPTPGDFTGDGKTDIALFRPSTGQWFVLRSDDFSYLAFPFGTNGDIPMPADYDGDGKTDPAVFRPSQGTWFISRTSDNQTTIAQFGVAGDKPVSADYDGDGKADMAVYRLNNGAEEWWVQRSSAGLFATVFGVSGDKAVPGDYTGDGKVDVAVWRPSNGNWFILRSEDLSFLAFPWGSNGDLPAPGDYDGDGKTDAAVFRASQSTWFINRTGGAGPLITSFGAPTDSPVAGAYVK